MKILAVIPFAALIACAPPDIRLNRSAVDALMMLDQAQYAGVANTAIAVARGCNQYRVDDAVQDALSNEWLVRNADRVARSNAAGVTIETDVARRSFQAKHGLTLDQDNTCAAIQAEIAEQSAVSAFLVPI